jgi:GTP-binding protein
VSDEAAFAPGALEAARVLFARPVRFLMGAVLINALVGRKALARASNEPGRTREVNLFLLDERLRLADLPGYGFARASKGTKSRFQNLSRAYLRGRPNLKRVYLLIDARHGLKAADTEALDALDLAAVSYQIVLTKADKLKPADVAPMIEAVLKAVSRRPAAFPRVLATSAESGLGIGGLRAEVAAAALTPT